jgi:hypothetical protein
MIAPGKWKPEQMISFLTEDIAPLVDSRSKDYTEPTWRAVRAIIKKWSDDENHMSLLNDYYNGEEAKALWEHMQNYSKLDVNSEEFANSMSEHNRACEIRNQKFVQQMIKELRKFVTKTATGDLRLSSPAVKVRQFLMMEGQTDGDDIAQD